MKKKISLLENENAFKILSRAQKLERTGKKIINLGIGQPDFSPPNHVIDAAISSLKNKPHGYTNSKGLIELREEIAKEYYELFRKIVSPDNILVSPGAKPIIYIAISMLTDIDSEVILPNPSFPIYKSVIKYCGAKPVYFRLQEQKNFNFNANDIIEKISNKTTLIILNSPCNPTGSVIRKRELIKLLKFIYNYPKKIFILSDEIYSKVIFDIQLTKSIIQYTDDYSNLIILNGLSKSFGMTGWRIGWGIFPKNLISNAEKYAVNIYSCVNNFSQYAAIAALSGSQKSVDYMKNVFKSRTRLMAEGLNKISGFKCNYPDGSFYCFPNIKKTGYNSLALQDFLLEKLGIATLDGNNFGMQNDEFIRISCCTTEENIKKALKTLSNYFNNK